MYISIHKNCAREAIAIRAQRIGGFIVIARLQRSMIVSAKRNKASSPGIYYMAQHGT